MEVNYNTNINIVNKDIDAPYSRAELYLSLQLNKGEQARINYSGAQWSHILFLSLPKPDQ